MAGSLMVVGGQWGDEGKGKVVDLLAAHFSVVVRYNGGHNAGHTVRFDDRRFALHLVPSGIVHPDVQCYLGAGMVIDPIALVTELDRLADEGVSHMGRLFVSPRATLILPTHGRLDSAREGALGDARIGTTGRGIGPSYQDLAGRRGLRAFLLAAPTRLRAEAGALMAQHVRELALLHGDHGFDLADALDRLAAAAARIAPLLREVGPEIRRHVGAGDEILFEGAQGVLLDLTWGSYPFVTSSSCLPGSAATSCGVGPRLLGPVIGIMKAYVTRVGSGPFPSELDDEIGEQLRERGAEVGTTTGRPRRCGWFDAVAARYAVDVAGIEAVALMKLDVLDGLEKVRVATAYRLPDGRRSDTVPADHQLIEQLQPLYEELPGWHESTRGVTDLAQLPPPAVEYLRFLEDRIGVPIVLVSTGPCREETIIRGDSPVATRLRGAVHGA